MNSSRRISGARPDARIALALAGLAIAGAAAAADGGGYPARPIRLISPFAPGGGNDAMSRAIGAKITEALGQQVVVDNRPGANGILACEIVAKANPDGYTLMMANIGSHAINPGLYRKLPYDAVRDFTAVSLLGITANVLSVPVSTPATRLADLVALAKAKPGQLTYGSNGTGSSQHLAGVLFGTAFGVSITHVPYKGTGPAMIDLIAGHLAMGFVNSVAAVPQVKAGKLRGLAVTGLRRSPVLPDLPAIAESSPGFEAVSWWGIVGPARMPAPVLATLHGAIARGIAAADMQESLARQGVEPRGSTPQEFDRFIRSELDKWTRVVRAAGASAD